MEGSGAGSGFIPIISDPGGSKTHGSGSLVSITVFLCFHIWSELFCWLLFFVINFRISFFFNSLFPYRIFSHPNVLPVIGCCNSPPNLVVIRQDYLGQNVIFQKFSFFLLIGNQAIIGKILIWCCNVMLVLGPNLKWWKLNRKSGSLRL